MEMVNQLMIKVVFMLENLKKEKSMDLVLTHGKTELYMLVYGKMANEMAKENSIF